VNVKSTSGDTARSLALMYGHTKIVSLIDNHILGPSTPLRAEPGSIDCIVSCLCAYFSFQVYISETSAHLMKAFLVHAELQVIAPAEERQEVI
jgi:hypothetical protein